MSEFHYARMVRKDGITANDYQRAALRTAPNMHFWFECEEDLAALLNGALGLCGEAGEVADLIKKAAFQGHELDEEKVIEELGDVAWYLAIASEALGVTLGEVLQKNVDKLAKRYPEGFDKASSINREEK